MFLTEEMKKYEDLSSDIVRGVNRINTSQKYYFIQLQPNEAEDTVKKELILPYINDDLWITSDLHLNHKNRNSSEFVNQMVSEINSKVSIKDAIMFCGDMGKKDDPNQKNFIKSFLDRLNPSIKILLLGNHDILPISDWYDMGFTFVTDMIKTKVGNDIIKFSHYPLPISDCDLNVHGHIHEDIEYWNLPWQKHINVYIHNHEDKIYKLKDYKKFYVEGKYKGKTVFKD